MGNRVELWLDDIRLEGEAEVFYELYVNLPTDVRDTVYTSPHYVGNLDFFGAMEGAQRRRFNLIPAFLRLRELNRWDEDTVRLTFVPRPFTEGDDPPRLLGGRTQAVVGRVSIRIE